MKRTIVALSFMVILNPVYEIMEMKGLLVKFETLGKFV
ncbi:hypothetical protein SDC9_32588 [bioreactor metagenome]|uniref:Uncharacterized protein n=1 Tax=bioreactor metagenome TaxID=1076179 RepID=A0A644V6E1_9ZZZZ